MTGPSDGVRMTGNQRTRIESAFARLALVNHFQVRVSLMDKVVDANVDRDSILNVRIESVSDNETVARNTLSLVQADIGANDANGNRATEFLEREAKFTTKIQAVATAIVSRTFEPSSSSDFDKDGLSPMGVVFIVLAVLISVAIGYVIAREYNVDFCPWYDKGPSLTAIETMNVRRNTEIESDRL